MDHNQEEIEETNETDDLDGIKSRLAGGRSHNLPHEDTPRLPQDAPPAKKQRKPRSDAGKPRAVKPVAPVASLDDDGAKKKHLALVARWAAQYPELARKQAKRSADPIEGGITQDDVDWAMKNL
jgi:hypothetical protein